MHSSLYGFSSSSRWIVALTINLFIEFVKTVLWSSVRFSHVSLESMLLNKLNCSSDMSDMMCRQLFAPYHSSVTGTSESLLYTKGWGLSNIEFWHQKVKVSHRIQEKLMVPYSIYIFEFENVRGKCVYWLGHCKAWYHSNNDRWVWIFWNPKQPPIWKCLQEVHVPPMFQEDGVLFPRRRSKFNEKANIHTFVKLLPTQIR
jgi:hypothetical protein